MNKFFQIEQFRKDGLKFIPTAQASEDQLPIELIALFDKYEKDGFRLFALDLVNVSRLSAEFVVTLLELTARLRRKGGNFMIYNLHYDILEDILTFNPKNYLEIATNGPHAGVSARTAARDSGMSTTRTVVENKRKARHSDLKVDRIEISYDEDEVYKACNFVTSRAAEMGFGENEVSRIKIAVYEACLNAIQHTRKMNPGDKVIVEVELMARTLLINVYDRGIGFDPADTREYDVTEAASHRKTGGMGLHIIRRAMDEVDYIEDYLHGNKLVMVKHLRN